MAAPAGLIGASNFFELSVAVAITLFGAASPVVLVTIVGVLVEVPVMLALVKFANRTRHWFPARGDEGGKWVRTQSRFAAVFQCDAKKLASGLVWRAPMC